MTRVRLLLPAFLAASMVMAQGPSVPENSVVNAGSFTPFGQPGHATAPGSIVAIFGTNLASSLAVASTVPLSTSLGGTSVTFNGAPAPLFFVSSGQINAQMPSGLSGTTASVVVTTGAGSSTPRTIQINEFSPAIFTTNQQGTGQGWVLFANSLTAAAPAGSIPGVDSRPARAGEILTIYCNGLGPVDPPVADGNNTLDRLRNTRTRPTVLVGNVPVPDGDILFSGLAPQFVALYQINFRMPSGAPAGDAVPIVIRIGGVDSSSRVTIAVQ